MTEFNLETIELSRIIRAGKPVLHRAKLQNPAVGEYGLMKATLALESEIEGDIIDITQNVGEEIGIKIFHPQVTLQAFGEKEK